MSDLQIVREQKIGFDAQGHRVSSDETYVKIAVTFRQVMRELRGARLSAFIILALNEAEISLGRSQGLSIYQIESQIIYNARTVLRSMQYLCKQNFAVALLGRSEKGETLYRVADYAWFGERRSKPPTSAGGYDKMSYPHVTNVIAGVTNALVEVEGTLPDEEKKTTTTTTSRKILHSVGVYATHLPEIEPERAARWAEFVSLAPRHTWHSPAGFCYATLRDDPQAEPPMLEGFAEALQQSGRIREQRNARIDFSDSEWHRMNPLNRRNIVAAERGLELPETPDDLHYGCRHE